tara:strand:- start:15239 stop:15457 length:219 start_codon:yes stop_codon:yes gene_type:complete
MENNKIIKIENVEISDVIELINLGFIQTKTPRSFFITEKKYLSNQKSVNKILDKYPDYKNLNCNESLINNLV